MKATALSLRGLTATHRHQTLGPVDLCLPAGAHGCLLGPPGAGKTLWLRAVAGLTPGAGAMRAGHTNLVGVPARRRGFAYLARNGAPAPLPSVAATLRFAQRARALPHPTPIADLLAEWDLDGATNPARLDPDQRLRARLAAAFAGEPRLLLLDQPLEHCVDRPALIARLREATGRRGTTVLHATTQRDEAFALATHLVLLDQGRVLQAGSAAELYNRPNTLFIAQRLGPANILPGRIESIEDDIASVRLDAGPVIEADPPAGDPPPNTPCRVLLRPERISISPLATADLGPGAIAAVLRDLTHMGDTIRATVAIGADTDIVVARPAGLGARGLIPARTVSIAWQSQHALTFME